MTNLSSRRGRPRLPLVLLAGLLWFGFSAPAVAQLPLSTDDLFVGEPVTVTLPEGSDTLFVTYRPNSSIITREALATAGQEHVTWTPAQAGVVALSTRAGAQRNVSVRFQSTPASGVLVLMLAGLILFGGATFALIKLFQEVPTLQDGTP